MVPCYNEEEALAATARTLYSLLGEMVQAGEATPESYICFVNDGSGDKRTTADLFYRLREWAGCYTIPNHADYRLMSRRAVGALKQFGEVNLFIRGIIPLLGFPSAKVHYARKARQQGESKYPLRKMLALAWNGLVNFSEAPLMLCVIVSMAGIVLSLVLASWAVWRWYVGATIPGWTSLLMVISVFSSMQFLFLGIIGLYVGKVMREAKHRPVFIVQDDCTRR